MNHLKCNCNIPPISDYMLEQARLAEESTLFFASKLQPVKEHDLQMLHFAINNHMVTGIIVYPRENRAIIDLRNSHRLHIEIYNGKDFEEPEKLCRKRIS